ncbi:MCE family protein [Tomitella fengzijianii]|uniref:MCE family protein n=1 Tax=Tomitella fengzijianii TaxID=2597660 RepID=A0A516X6F4_9ACTN|nr:MCE family protein [Tomitella fengzijianii]QDQ98649.1 MCE family protein [Tomitella fengzijianii]
MSVPPSLRPRLPRPFGPRYTGARRRRVPGSVVKMLAFATVMLLILGFLVLVFGRFRTGERTGYQAVFADSSGMSDGAPVRVAGVQVGRVENLVLREDSTVAVAFTVDAELTLPADSRATIRYENLVGDRYLEVLPPQGTATSAPMEPTGAGTLAPGAVIPVAHTSPALDLDLLLGGFQPLFRALDPGQVNRLTAALIDTFQGRGQSLASLVGKTGRFTQTLADSDAVIGRVIDNLNTVLDTVADRGTQFDDVITRLQELVSSLAAERDPLGEAVTRIDAAAQAAGGLLHDLRPPLDSTIDQLGRTTALIEQDEANVSDLLARLPETYQLLSRTGSYGDFFQFYMCGLVFRFTGADGEMFEYPMVQQYEGRCAPK